MSEQIKISDSEKQRIFDIRQNFAENITEIGQAQVSIKLLEQKLNDLFDEYKKLEVQSDALVKSLSESYGDGVVDLENGIFIKHEK